MISITLTKLTTTKQNQLNAVKAELITYLTNLAPAYNRATPEQKAILRQKNFVLDYVLDLSEAIRGE